ncbi:Alpha/Beta hydrolase protein [Phakopsora pachyrhizi]|uniref:Alpha/Beta hydrolase protein n=1 Tax=Phakopsora pachyrhizi TaxID=170000 RepID=A0AAV0B569_PHAPC|nr:Alpha/Beta hydrolase protein [Phakopsora pachyrhizi]
MRLRDGSHSSAQNEVPGVYNIGTDYGQSLSRFNLAYVTWGILSSAKDNVILLHIALSASSHAKSHDLNKSFGWWEKFIGHGPNYSIDLNWYFVICTNILGSCYGSTGPSSINPETNEPMGPISQSSQSLTRVGSSMGGMQSIVTAWLEPQRFQRVLSISGCWKNRSIKYCFTICSTFRKSLSTPSFSNFQHLQKRLSSLVSHSPEHQSSLSVQLANHSSAVMDSRTSLEPINDSNNVQNQCLRFNARRPLKENRRSGKLLMEEVDQEHCISLNED